MDEIAKIQETQEKAKKSRAPGFAILSRQWSIQKQRWSPSVCAETGISKVNRTQRTIDHRK